MEARFLKHVDKTDTCWNWKGAKTLLGYGRHRNHYKIFLSHRTAYSLWIGEIPDGLVVRHKCDNRACVNPEHLEIGTQLDNIQDTIRRGRHAKGESSGNAKLTWNQVQEIREKLKTKKNIQLAGEYGIGRCAISNIKLGKTWNFKN